MHFPHIAARDLEGRSIDIPGGLRGAPNVVVLAFKREHQGSMESWLPHLAQLEMDFPGLEAWQVAALPRTYRLWRGAIDGAIKAGVSDPRVHRHTLTAYLDVGDLKRELGARDLSEIRLYLLETGGNVRWQGTGRFSEETLASLRVALEQAAPA